MALLAAVLLVSGGYAAKTALDFQEETAIYDEVQTTFVTIIEEDVPLASLPTDLPTASIASDATDSIGQTDENLDLQSEAEVILEAEPEIIISLEPGISVNFQGLIQVNEDILAWLHIPNTVISYPVLQGEDNQSYLYTAYDGSASSAGSLFFDYRISGDLTDQNTIIYGHNMSSGVMFAQLTSYQSASYLAQHPYFFLLTESGYLRYEIFSVMITPSTSDVYRYTFTEENSFSDHIAMLTSQSLYTTGVTVSDSDKIVTLSTCTNLVQSDRLVVIGRLDED